MATFDCLEIRLEPIGTVVSTRVETTDDFWDKEQCFVELFESFGNDSLLGLSEFSHAEIIFYMDQVDPEGIENSARHPGGGKTGPRQGYSHRGQKTGLIRLASLFVGYLDWRVRDST